VFLDKLRSMIEHDRLSDMLTDEYRYKILKILEQNPKISQRYLARELGASLGRTNYCLKALIKVGLLKVTNFRNNRNKLTYIYLLTPSGIKEKSLITERFLKSKLQEYEALEAEINELRNETKNITEYIKESY
jgi:EPS-associated MarR family transcriptional regulator